MTKEEERNELHKAIWNIAEDLRNKVDAWDFKNYVLGFLFYRYLSENLANEINQNEREAEEGDPNFNYAELSDEEAEYAKDSIIEEKGFFLYPSQLFENVAKNAENDENLNETIQHVFDGINASVKGRYSERDLSGLFDDVDVNSSRLGGDINQRNERLAKILKSIADLKLGSFEENTIDAFGDTYEFLMGMYASTAGKSGGEYYTPQEVSELLTLIATNGKEEINKVYDPACGSGSLLLKSAKILGKDKIRDGFYGQEVNPTTYNLCRINMLLHDIAPDDFDIALGDTLTNPYHWDKEPFDVIVSNPPYSLKWEGADNPVLVNDERYSPAGVLAPKSKADMAFIMHMLSWLSPQGTAAIVCFPGILYRGGAEQKIRKYLIDNNFISTVIQLPANLFYGVGISTCILVLRKDKQNNDILFIDASNQFVKQGKDNKLTRENIENILKLYEDRKDIEYQAKLVLDSLVKEEDYNLSVSTYVEPEDTREKIDIEAVNRELKQLIDKENEIRKKIDLFIKKFGVDHESFF